MLRVTMTSLWARKRRLVGTGLAVVFAMAFLSGTLVLGDTLRSSFTADFTAAYEGIDAIAEGDATVGGELGQQTSLVDAALVDEVVALDGVSAAAGEIEGTAFVMDADGEGIGGNGPPTIGVNWIADDTLNTWEVVEGRAPTTDGEVVLDVSTAETGGLAVGDTTTVRTPTPLEVQIVGLIDGTAANGGVTVTAFTDDQAREVLLGGSDQVTRVLVASDGSMSDEALVEQIDAIAPTGVETLTASQAIDQAMSDLGADFLDFFTTMLLGFAVVALVVAAFGINNTFAITIAQRARESALLRAVGASRGQVLSSVLVEAVAIGVIASALGLVAGLGLAMGLQALMGAAGGLDAAPLVVTLPTVALTVGVGMAVTVFAAVLPAVKASRVRPVEALRDAAVDESGVSVVRRVAGVLITGVGVGLVAIALAGSGSVMLPASIGGIATLVGVVVLGPVVARPVAGALSLPLARLRGVTGAVARRNSLRSPRRTAGTASALMVGMAVVVMFTVVAASVQNTVTDQIDRTFGGDLVVADMNFSGPGFSPDLATELDDLSEVEVAVGSGYGAARIDGEDVAFDVADVTRLQEVFSVPVLEGDLATVDPDEIVVASDVAEANGWDAGSTATMWFVDGQSVDVRVGAVFDRSAGGSLGSIVVPPALWADHTISPAHYTVLVDLADGVSLDDGRAAIESVTTEHGDPLVQDRDEYIAANVGQIDVALTIVYAMLGLAILIALMGITNTLSLSVHERTRELGLLRAVGQTRSQTRSMVRMEAVVTALFGTIGGVGLGMFLGWTLFEAVGRELGFASFALPVPQLGLIALLGGLVGVVAAIRPARRAARTDILAAIATE